jgi:WD40 repeat protein
MDNTIKIWDARSGYALLQHYPAHADAVTSIAFHPSGHYLLSTSLDRWDVLLADGFGFLFGHTCG